MKEKAVAKEKDDEDDKDDSEESGDDENNEKDEDIVNLKTPKVFKFTISCLLYTSPSPRDKRQSRMPSSA